MRRTVASAGLLVIAAGIVWVPAGAVGRAGHFAANARAELARFETIRPVIPAMVDAALAPAEASVSTVGLEAGGTTHARAANGEAIFFGAGGGAGPTVAEQRAGDDNAGPTEVATPRVVAGPLDAGTGSSRAHARRVDAGAGICPEPEGEGTRTLSSASTELTDVHTGELIEIGSPDGDGASGSDARITLEPIADGRGAGVRARASSRVGSISVAGAYELRVIGEPELLARANGRPGGASISYSAPAIEVVDLGSGETVAQIDASQHSVDLPADPVAGSFITVRLGVVHDAIVLDDGTHASAEADLVSLRFTDPAGAYEQFDLRVATLSVSATSPAGGVTTCDGTATMTPDLPHAIVYSGWRTFEHLSIGAANRAIAAIANDTGAFTVSFTNEATFLRPEVLAETDVIIWNNATGSVPWTDEQKDLFVSWLSCGGGTVGIHAAADANHSWPEYTELMGARFRSHPHVGYWPTVGDVTIQVEDQTHPATAPWHGQASFRMADELYLFVEDPRGTQDLNVLLSLDEQTTYPWVQAGAPLPSPFGPGPYPADQPLAWTKTFRGEGRVFYTNLGHNPFTFAREDFLTHLRNGVAWVTEVRPAASCLSST